ncbi:MAG: hypothetical protein WA347_04815 [Rhabdochlamydiaceae bacterium]
MVNSIQIVPTDILSEVYIQLNDSDDITACTLVSNEWNQTIRQNLVCKQVIRNVFPQVDEQNFPRNNCYELFNALQLSKQIPSNFNIRSPEIDALNAIDAELEQMRPMCGYHHDYDQRVSVRLDQLPNKIQARIYNQLKKIWQPNIDYDFPEWGEQIFHSGDHRRNLPSCTVRRGVISIAIGIEKLSTLGRILMPQNGFSKRSREKAIKQFAFGIGQDIKDGIYLKIEFLLTRKGLFNPNSSGKEAFYDPAIPTIFKGCAINMYVNSLANT